MFFFYIISVTETSSVLFRTARLTIK